MITVLAEGVETSRLDKFSFFLKAQGLSAFIGTNSLEGWEEEKSYALIVFGEGAQNLKCLRMESIDLISAGLQSGDPKIKEKLTRLISKANEMAKESFLSRQKEVKQFQVDENITSAVIDEIVTSLSLDNIKEMYEKYNLIIYSKALDKNIFIGSEEMAPGGDVQYLTPIEFHKLYKVLEATQGTVTSIEDSKQAG